MYKEYDGFSINRMVNDEIDKQAKHYYDNFYAFNKDVPQRRIEKTEKDLIDAY